MHIVNMWSHILDFFMQAELFPTHHCSAIISLSTAVFYVKPLRGILMEFVISLCNPIADESSTSINEVNTSTTFGSDDVPSL